MMTRVLVTFGSLVLFGCSGNGHPPPASYTVIDSEMSLVRPASEQGHTPAKVCEPGETRECKYYYRSPNGQVNCPVSVQICRRDGFGWHRCNDLDPNETEPLADEGRDRFEVIDEPPLVR